MTARWTSASAIFAYFLVSGLLPPAAHRGAVGYRMEISVDEKTVTPGGMTARWTDGGVGYFVVSGLLP